MVSNHWRQPEIDPILIHLWGPFSLRWYSILYVGGFLVGMLILKRLSKEDRFPFTEKDIDQLIMWLLVGAVLGARIVYCLVYDPTSFFSNPLYLFQIYRGGLSFHGGFLGLMVAAFFFGRKHRIPFWNLCDAMVLSGPVGLAMGRLGNFINGELYGRVSNVPWAIIFKDGGPQPRHPSQLYELFLEGIFLFGLLWFLKNKLTKDGQLSVVFILGYALCRFIVEFFREPDAQVGYLALGLSMGQWLSVGMLCFGISLAFYFRKKYAASK